jgi:hypothetical protein
MASLRTSPAILAHDLKLFVGLFQMERKSRLSKAFRSPLAPTLKKKLQFEGQDSGSHCQNQSPPVSLSPEARHCQMPDQTQARAPEALWAESQEPV